MKKVIIIYCSCLSIMFAQNVIWSYHATGTLWSHFRATRTISDVDGDLHDDVIAVSENDTLYCFSGVSGAVVWRFVADPCYVERGLISVPDLNGDTIADVILGTVWGTRKVFAISGGDGSVIWEYDTHEYGSGGWIYEVSMTEDVTGDSVVEILASAGGPDATRSYLFNGATGAKIWEDNAGYPCFGVRAIGDITGDGISDVGACTGNYVASAYSVRFLDGATGSLIRAVALPASGLTVVPLGDINDDTLPDIACGTGGGDVLALSGADGSVLWTVSAGGMIWDLNILPDIDGNGYPELLPSGTALYSFLCISALNGSTLWSAPAVDQIFVSIAVPDINNDGIGDVVGGTGYTSSMLYLLDGSSGTSFWELPMASPIESAYWIDDISGNGIPDILAGTREGWMYALEDGNVGIAQRPKPEPCISSLIGIFGRLQVRHNLPMDTPARLNIYSVLGQEVMGFDIRFDGDPMTIDVSQLPAGVYFGCFHGEGWDEVVKFVLVE